MVTLFLPFAPLTKFPADILMNMYFLLFILVILNFSGRNFLSLEPSSSEFFRNFSQNSCSQNQPSMLTLSTHYSSKVRKYLSNLLKSKSSYEDLEIPKYSRFSLHFYNGVLWKCNYSLKQSLLTFAGSTVRSPKRWKGSC